MGRRPNYDNGGFQQNKNNSRNTNQGVFGRLAQQPVNQGGGWGSGQRNNNAGNQPGQQRDDNRFRAYNQPEQNRGPQNNRGGQRANRQQPQNVDWQAVARDDMKNERPKWPFTCYSHIRDGNNDLTGDFSFEEVRWAEMAAAQGGRSVASLVADFNVASKALDQQWQALLRAGRPPSMGGPPIEPPVNSFSGPAPFQPATPFGQVVGAFGSRPSAAAMTPSPAFGIPFQRSPAEAMPTAGPFGGTPSPFGKAAAFSAPAQLSPFQAQAQPPAMSVLMFAQQPQAQQPHAFQQSQAESPFPSPGQVNSGAAFEHAANQLGEVAAGAASDNSINPWLAPAFERGHIPETPPPREVC